MISKVVIRNYRMFRELDIEFTPGFNILVGANNSGKSTLIEAINLALTGRINGRFLAQEFSPYYINQDATREYIDSLTPGDNPPLPPPEIIIDVFFEDEIGPELLMGTNNLTGENCCGVRIQAKISEEYSDEYENFISEPESVRLAPTEYYRVEWLGFSGNGVSARSVPATASVIDPTTIRLHSGVDYHLQQIINTHLEPKERVELSRQYRSFREEFSGKESVREINERLREEDEDLSDRDLSLAIDISSRYTWEASLVAHLDDLPFQVVGKGDQISLKTILALGRQVEDAHVVLIEEPENHLSFASLRKLINRIEDRCEGKQVITATHSNYVLNKLGLQNLHLLGEGNATRITDLPEETVNYFKKLAGYDTLRLVLAEGAILVEGPSDELVVQRGYFDVHDRYPIEDGIDVISVGLSHKRFLDIAVRLNRRAWIVTDNDGKAIDEIRVRFDSYLENENVSLNVSDDPGLRTLEPQIVAVNDLEVLNEVLGRQFETKDEALKFMLAEKTTAALSIFESQVTIEMPGYIQEIFNG